MTRCDRIRHAFASVPKAAVVFFCDSAICCRDSTLPRFCRVSTILATTLRLIPPFCHSSAGFLRKFQPNFHPLLPFCRSSAGRSRRNPPNSTPFCVGQMTSFVCVARFSRRAAVAAAVAERLTHGGATDDRSGGHSEAEQVRRYRTAVDGAGVERIERQTRGFDHRCLVLWRGRGRRRCSVPAAQYGL